MIESYGVDGFCIWTVPVEMMIGARGQWHFKLTMIFEYCVSNSIFVNGQLMEDRRSGNVIYFVMPYNYDYSSPEKKRQLNSSFSYCLKSKHRFCYRFSWFNSFFPLSISYCPLFLLWWQTHSMSFILLCVKHICVRWFLLLLLLLCFLSSVLGNATSSI